ncbi:hypothetical protein Gohar_021165 [Gossypium harknessii]|uniref:Uncharacterized protein n=1 Tax=Gossypium harknessii TaxID=34285 RepID=A0A7J9I684_9ROSI|nr:hypothetical protein [Gossypium harknessii]
MGMWSELGFCMMVRQDDLEVMVSLATPQNQRWKLPFNLSMEWNWKEGHCE